MADLFPILIDDKLQPGAASSVHLDTIEGGKVGSRYMFQPDYICRQFFCFKDQLKVVLLRPLLLVLLVKVLLTSKTREIQRDVVEVGDENIIGALVIILRCQRPNLETV